MAKYEFSIRYSGEAVEDGRIPIKELAPSLLALSDAFHEVQSISNPSDSELSLDIKATEKGSFKVMLLLTNGNDLLRQAIDLLNGNETTAIANLVMYVGILSASITFIKKMHNRKIKKEKALKNNYVEITFDDNTKLVIPKDSVEACKNVTFRKSVKEIARPLNSDGIDKIELSRETSVEFSITKDEKDYFEVPETKPKELDSSESEIYLQIINVAFEHGKWKFSNGTNQFFATILDEDFIKSVEKNQQQFGSTDTLKVLLRNTQTITNKGLQSEFFVIKVLEHIKGSQQIELDLE